MSGRLLRILLAVAGPVFMGALAFGQAINSAQIHGIITDPTGAAIVGAEIKATQIATGLVRTTTSSAEGTYYFPDLPVGAYQLAVTASGFET
ncbi:MAG TPA: carboxypeptidase-like regulatory domain-containing protein, partial [Bryobacteraceae bacterium]|nr:carboxypeptidase-like regulatory domain-containing protein [Bryobacteraceae bacterium]